MSEPADQAGRSRLLRNAVAAVLAVLLVASVVGLVLALREDDEATSAADDRDAAMLAARSYVEAASNFGPDDLDEQQLLTAYRDRVTPLVSNAYKEAFEQEVSNVTPLAVQGYGVTTTVDRAGVSEISADRASVLVGGETSRSLQDKTEEGQGYTLEISLVKVDGSWLVDAAPCNIAQNPTCETTTPSGGATTGPTDQPTEQESGQPGKKSKDDSEEQETSGEGEQ